MFWEIEMIHQFLNLFALYKIKKKALPTGLQVIIRLLLSCWALWWFVHLTKFHLDQGSIQWDVHSLDSVLTLLHGREGEKAAPLITFVWAFASPVPFSWSMKMNCTALDYEAKIKYMRTNNQLCRQTDLGGSLRSGELLSLTPAAGIWSMLIRPRGRMGKESVFGCTGRMGKGFLLP